MQRDRDDGVSEFGSQFDLYADDGVRLVSLVLGLTIYTNVNLSNQAKAILSAYDRFLEWCPRESLKFYATETMRQHKPIKKSTLSMLPTWLKAGAPEREFIRLQLKDGSQYQDAARYKFDVLGIEPKSKQFKLRHANLLSLAFPPDPNAASSIRDRFVELCTLLQFQSGYAGFSFECSKYEAEASHSHAWGLSMRHPGIDINRNVDDAIAVGQDGMKGVGWLTALNKSYLAQLGGLSRLRQELPREVEFIDLPYGAILQAGPAPSVGDLNKGDTLPLQRSIFKLVAPLVNVAARRSPSFNLATDYVERTEAWFMRLGND